MRIQPRRCAIPDLLEKYGWTQRQLAEKSGVDEREISFYTTGRRMRMSLATAVMLADALNVNPRELYEWSSE
ncbi:helix-turn-helix transcriptional regulator [Paenibacillus sp. J5C_2022]|uniref:helix-turn-helix domain-containing protein n=1 Tax=Paenibacillus sp. J5C2022 TaxID=2977129 RepID=UPI0021D17B5D|nr:helix-turn-helix transcriptional regulator [Paenibacillus sp. J5C2022]MCU6709303.1 helix-turn-helix transcriptional regulator [Paenibacillus sp. J5C2022]